MKKLNTVNNGRLTGMSDKEILADVLSHMVVYIEARNSFDNNKDCPLSGEDYIDSFDEDIVKFILGNNIKDWVEIPDYYILDSVERKNFIHYIKWSEGITPITR